MYMYMFLFTTLITGLHIISVSSLPLEGKVH